MLFPLPRTVKQDCREMVDNRYAARPRFRQGALAVPEYMGIRAWVYSTGT
jgi:hypothetical protein